MVSSVCLITSGQIAAAPSPIDDEDFLLFLADSLEEDGATVDPLTMIEGVIENTVQSDSQNKSQNQNEQQQEDKNEH